MWMCARERETETEAERERERERERLQAFQRVRTDGGASLLGPAIER